MHRRFSFWASIFFSPFAAATPLWAAVPAPQNITLDTSKNYAVIVAASAVIVTALTWIGTQFFAARQRKLNKAEANIEEARKQITFFALVESETKHIIESLRTSKEILESINPDTYTQNSFVSHVRVASNISRFRSFEHEWDKLYIIGPDNIRLLRSFNLALDELDVSFKRTLQDAGALYR
jgi:hypothetical protein